MRRSLLRFFAVLLWSSAGVGQDAIASSAATRAMSLEVGWGNTYRAGSWTPIYLTASDMAPREVIAQIEGPHEGLQAMRISYRFAIGPDPATHVMYYPLGEGYQLRDTVVVLRDAKTLKRLDSHRLALNPAPLQAPLDRLMIGVSGDSATFGVLKMQLAPLGSGGFVPQTHLPMVPAGYEGIDALVLSAPDLAQLQDAHQRPIVEWLRAGGTLLLAPGSVPVPQSGPLIDVLPAVLGDVALVELDPAAVAAAGLPPRVRTVHGRRLSPAVDAQRVPILGAEVVAYRRAVGFGEIVVLPIDVSGLIFRTPEAAAAFWRPLIGDMSDPARTDAARARTDDRTNTWLRSMSAMRWRVVPTWLLAALVIAGPVDSLLLVLMSRRPVTIVTGLAWCGLLGGGGVFLYHRSLPRVVDYHSVRVLDEVDGAAAAVTDRAALRWPRGSSLELPHHTGAWWRPAYETTVSPATPISELATWQSEGGNSPARMAAHVPTPRILHAQQWTASEAIIAGKLTLSTVAGQTRLSGRLTNRGAAPLVNLRVRSAGGVARIDVPPLAPGATIEIDAAIEAGNSPLQIPATQGNAKAPQQGEVVAAAPDYASAEAMTHRRSRRLDALLQDPARVCVYAEVLQPAAPLKMAGETRETHVVFVRSLMRLE